MIRALAAPLFTFLLLASACNVPEESLPLGSTGGTGGGGAKGTSDSGGSGGIGKGKGGAGVSTTGAGGTAGGAGETGGTGGTGPIDAPVGAGGSGPVDAPEADKPASPEAGGGEVGGEGDEYPGKPVVRLCKKDWTHEQCCDFLCKCLGTICADSAKGKPGIANCGTWCPKLSDMAMRCHVYHCYISISPTGGIKDHDSHCGHAANQVAGGGCPELVYK